MSILQKFINLLAIAASIAILYTINSNLAVQSRVDDSILFLTEIIGKGELLTDNHLDMLTFVLSKKDSLQTNTPICFLQAYSQVAIKQKIFPQNIFSIFEAGNEFAGIQKCEHYYSLLIYRTTVSQHQQKTKILSVLDSLLQKKLIQNNKSSICLYFYAHDSQITAKEQTSQIIAQQYQNFNSFIEVDSAADNSLMFAKYTLEQSKDTTKNSRVHVNSQKERKGFLGTLINVIDNKCSDSQIVIVMDKNSVLLSRHSLSLVNDYLSMSNNEIAAFRSLTIKHSNVQSNIVQDIPNSYPVLAFKKSVYPKFAPLVKKVQSNKNFTNYEHQIFTYALLKQFEASYVDQVIAYRPNRNLTEQEQLSKLWLEFNE